VFLRLTLLIIGLAASYIGSLCFQGGSGADMAVGGGAILIGILCFFFLAKGLWRFLGCLSTFILMAVVVGILFFFVSGSDILNNLTANITSYFSNDDTKEDGKSSETQNQEQAPENTETNTEVKEKTAKEQTAVPLDPQLLIGLPPGAMQQMQPMQQTAPSFITGKITSIVSGDVFRMGQSTVRLYGLASPLIDQKCYDNVAHAYDCGYVAARMLKDFISGDDVNCRVMNTNAKGELMAACSVGSFDIGAAMVEAGWAIALPAVTPIYLPYQQKAQEGKKGMWKGQFQMPWEWAAQQQQLQERAAAKVNVPNIPSPKGKKKGKSIFDFL
jgi:endonuclease YncB( thermonuclease family)